MAPKLELPLKELGSKLGSLPSSKDALVKLLKQVGTCLAELDQSPSPSILELMQPILKAIVKPDLLKHQDRDVKLLVATCLCEITRITAPEAPYDDDDLKDIFQLIVGTFSGLTDTTGPSFGRRVIILETLAKYRSCVVMLDLECDDLVNKMFSTFFAVASDEHPENVLTSMQTIMVVLLEESEDIHEDLLLIVLSKLGRNMKGASMAARKLAMNVIESCSVKLEPVIKQFLVSSISGDSEPLDEQIDYHEVIYDLYKCAPQLLSGVIPYLTGELLTDQLDTRLKAVRLVGDLFSLPGHTISEIFQPIFSEFLKRLTDRAVEIRLSVLEHVKNCLLSDPSRAEGPQIILALCDRLLDYDENVRKQVVGVICDVACQSPGSVPAETIKLISDRLRDKSALVKKFTMEKLADIFRMHLEQSDESDDMKFDWIPGKILRCFYDRDFRSETIESVLSGALFPGEISLKERVKCWMRFSALFDKVEIKALERILEQKQRLQQEMQRYISLRQTYQTGDAPETQKKVQFCFRVMSRFFPDPAKTEENFQILDQLKDSNIWKILASLLDPNTSCQQSSAFQDDLLRILSEKHRLYDFLGTLSMKCSYLLFNKEHVKALFEEASAKKSVGNTQYVSSCMNILVTLVESFVCLHDLGIGGSLILARYSPSLLIGFEEDLVSSLKDDSDIVKEGALHILAKAGGIVREQLATLSSSADLILERLCLEGSRRQAKYAVHALAAITKDDGLKSLSVLYKRLVDMLEEKTHLPAVLQSLGCIAQTAMPVFETRESEIEEFIKTKILNCSNKVDHNTKTGWDDRSDQCLLKIYGIKTLVKSYLPVKDAHLRPGIDSLIGTLRNVLSFGEVAEDVESGIVDKAHMKLASAKAILRLSKYWDDKIPFDVLQLALRVAESGFPQARKIFLSKIHQYIKDRLLDLKYSCAFLFDIDGSKASECEEKQYLSEIIQLQWQAKARQQASQSETNSLATHPDYLLSYVVHVLAHHLCPDVDDCKDVKAYESLYWKLYLIVSMLVHGDDDGKSENNNFREQETSSVTCIFHTIKRAEDVIDAAKSKSSHAICDLGLSIVKRLTKTEVNREVLPVPAALPVALYKLYESTEEDGSQAHERTTWLADERILAHFNSLQVSAENPEETDLKANDKEGTELPLKKMIKRSKPQGTKSRKGKSIQSEKEKVENDIDVLKMVREINLDSMSLSSKFDSSNGHGHTPSKPKLAKGERMHQNGDSHEASVATLGSVPKRRRSSTAQRIARKSEDKAFSHKKLVGSPSLDLLAPSFSKKKASLSKQKGKGSDEEHAEELDEESTEIRSSDDKMHTSNVKSPSDSMKKRKRNVIGGLAKCTMSGSESLEELIGCKIKVWWPMDKKFYEGTVKSYDPSRNKHVVLYNDGDVEIINLEKERWELIDKGHKSAKKSRSLKTSPSKRVIKAKRTPKKKKQAQSDEAEDNHSVSEVSCEEPSTSTGDDDMKLDDLEHEKGSNRGVHQKLKMKLMGRETSDEETKNPIQDNKQSDDEEDASLNVLRKKGSNKRARSQPESEHVKGKKRSVGRKVTSGDDGDNPDDAVQDDRESDEEENILKNPAKKRASNTKARSSLKRKPLKGKKRDLHPAGASDYEGRHDTDTSLKDAENSDEEDTLGNVTRKKRSNKRAPSKPRQKAIRDKLESVGPVEESDEEEVREDVKSLGEDDKSPGEEENPASELAGKEESDTEADNPGSKMKHQVNTKEPETSAEESTEIPDDEPLRLWKTRVGKSLKKVG